MCPSLSICTANKRSAWPIAPRSTIPGLELALKQTGPESAWRAAHVAERAAAAEGSNAGIIKVTRRTPAPLQREAARRSDSLPELSVQRQLPDGPHSCSLKVCLASMGPPHPPLTPGRGARGGAPANH